VIVPPWLVVSPTQAAAGIALSFLSTKTLNRSVRPELVEGLRTRGFDRLSPNGWKLIGIC
jgi:hypothetical protein